MTPISVRFHFCPDGVREYWLEGEYTPACRAWGGSRGEPPVNPPEPASIEIQRGTRDGLPVTAEEADDLVNDHYDELVEAVERRLEEVEREL